MSNINRKYLNDLKRNCEVPHGIKREQVIRIMELLTLTFPNVKDPIVGFGGVLCLEGVRAITSDLDVSIRPEDAKMIEESGIFEFVIEVASSTGKEIPIYRCGVLDVHLNEIGYTNDAVTYQNYRFKVMTLESILYFKKQWNRPKDQDDIKNIEKLLESRKRQRDLLDKQYAKVSEVCRVSPLEKDDILKLTHTLNEYFPHLKDCEIDDNGALCLHGVIDSVPSITFMCPKRHIPYLKGMGIFVDSYVVENNKPVDTLKCGALNFYFDDPVGGNRLNPAYGFIVPTLQEILKRKERSKNPEDNNHVRMLKTILR